MKKKYLVAIISKLLMILCSFLSTILINRMLGPVQKGRYAYIINIVEILYLILSFGLGQTYSQFARNDDKRIKQIIHFLIFFHSTICIIIFSIFFIIFSSKSLIIIGVLTSISILSNNISMIAVIENSINRNITISLFKIVYIFLLCIGSICTNISFYLCLIFYGVYELSTSIYFLFKYKLYKTSFKFDLNDLKHIYSNGIIIMLVLVLTTINYSIDSIMLEKISGSFYTGVYSVATTFGNIALIIPDAFKELLFSKTSHSEAKQDLSFSFKFSSVVNVLFAIVFYFGGKFAISFLYGSDYSAAYFPSLVIIFANFFLIIFKLYQPVYISFGNQAKLMKALLVGAIVNVLMNLCFIPKYDIRGASFSSFISYGIIGIFILYDFRHSKPISDS